MPSATKSHPSSPSSLRSVKNAPRYALEPRRLSISITPPCAPLRKREGASSSRFASPITTLRARPLKRRTPQAGAWLTYP